MWSILGTQFTAHRFLTRKEVAENCQVPGSGFGMPEGASTQLHTSLLGLNVKCATQRYHGNRYERNKEQDQQSEPSSVSTSGALRAFIVTTGHSRFKVKEVRYK